MVGWLIPKQGPNPSKPPQITPKIALFDPNFTFRTPKSHKNPGVGGWVNRFGRDLPKKTVFFFGSPPYAKRRESPSLICVFRRKLQKNVLNHFFYNSKALMKQFLKAKVQ